MIPFLNSQYKILLNNKINHKPLIFNAFPFIPLPLLFRTDLYFTVRRFDHATFFPCYFQNDARRFIPRLPRRRFLFF